MLTPLECREACNQIAQYSVELRRYLLLMGAGLGLRDKRYMAKKRRIGRFTLKEDRRLIRMAATSATPEKAAAIFRTSVDTIERTCRRLGIQLGRDGRELEPKVKR